MGIVQKGRESLATRLGFLFIAAGCAIGLGNVWRFPYITGKYGGAAFVLIYIFFLVTMALPVMIMEFSVGRASQTNIAGAFRKLEPAGAKWHIYGYLGILGNYVLMMFYTVVSGWMLAYVYYTVSGQLSGLSPDQVGAFFGGTLASPARQLFWMAVVIFAGFGVCAIGLRGGVEKVTKFMMSGLFIIVILLAARAVTLDGAGAGIEFYLKPDFNKLLENGLWTSIYAAMGQAFFTLSVGIGSMLIFGSYLGKDRSLTGESLHIMGLDLLAAFMAGMIIFPSCFAFGVEPGAGPGLIFVTLPNVFNSMGLGILWGTLFFVFMTFAAMSTVIAVFENIVAYGIDNWKLSRRASVGVNLILMLILATPCALGFNVLADFQPLGPGSVVLDLEDFIVSNNLLPLGSLIFVLFCSSRYGWGWDKFVAEADTGRGLKFPSYLKPYFKYVLPIIILIIFIQGYYEIFQKLTAQ
ncbi:sodium-dependent transporter [Deltaproteobacteria bacterium OttesenSCG-928-K17]|nr:sodium-dependent transporter [Deltaproteobacteria bacterium OttesenSCG-928-K17]